METNQNAVESEKRERYTKSNVHINAKTYLDGMKPAGCRIVNAEAYIGAIREMVSEGYDVSMIITGNSMSPFLIHSRDTIVISRPDRPLKKGDMVFYQRDNGRFVMHRIYKVKKTPDGKVCFDIVGDAQTVIESGIREDQIFGLIIKVCRKGKWMEPGDFWWAFFENVWIRIIPLRRFVVRLYSMSFGKDKKDV